MKRVFCAALFGLIAAPALHGQTLRTVLLASSRAGNVEFIDSQSLETIASLKFTLPAPNSGLNGAALSADAATLYVDGPTPNAPHSCCVLYAVNLITFQATIAASIPGTASRNLLLRSDGIVYPAAQLIAGAAVAHISDDLLHLSPDANWLFGVKSFRGPAIEAYSLAHGGARQELRPTAMTGNWWPSGVWSGGNFYLNLYGDSGDRLYTVAPGDGQLSAGLPVTQPDGCSPTWLSGITAAAGRLFLYQNFGFKVDQQNICGGTKAGGMWTVEAATGHLGQKLATDYRFSYLLPDPNGKALYGLDSGEPHWGSTVRIVRLDPATGATLATRTLDAGVWSLAAVPMSAPPSGPHLVWQ